MKNYWQPGDWNAVCSMCGRKKKASDLVRNWQGMWRCKDHNEERHPQDYVRGVREVVTVPWAQPPGDTYIYVCDINGRSAYPGRGIPNCLMPGNIHFNPELPSPTLPPLCTIYTKQAVPSWGGPGCMIPSHDPMAPVVNS